MDLVVMEETEALAAARIISNMQDIRVEVQDAMEEMDKTLMVLEIMERVEMVKEVLPVNLEK